MEVVAIIMFILRKENQSKDRLNNLTKVIGRKFWNQYWNIDMINSRAHNLNK